MRKIWRVFLPLLLCWGAWILNPATAWAVDTNLEATILDVIQQHPEAILRSLVTYQAQQQEQEYQAQLQTLNQLKQNIPAVIGSSPVLKHSQDSAVTLIEFGDYECPFCIEAHPQLQRFLEQHPSIALVYKHLPLVDIHPEALPAAKASWAALQQGKFWEFHNALFERQGNLNEQVYQKIATRLKLNLEKFDRDRNSFAATEAIAQNMQIANNLKIKGTPSFLIITNEVIRLIPGLDFQSLIRVLKPVILK
ncbi:MAG: DsbA family protein [Leptolyngbyaceae cyanobacterium bins.302]|nr:DsbA family protein [Leptolyngbyaceae cyanobacterium bins.302]